MTSLEHKALHCVDIQKATSNSIHIHGYFYPEDGCSMFLLNISSPLQDYMVLQPEDNNPNNHCYENLKTYKPYLHLFCLNIIVMPNNFRIWRTLNIKVNTV
jgi:hypothetical protein